MSVTDLTAFEVCASYAAVQVVVKIGHIWEAPHILIRNP